MNTSDVQCGYKLYIYSVVCQSLKAQTIICYFNLYIVSALFFVLQSCAVIMENADEVLPLASNHGGKLFHVVRSSFVDSLEACLKSYHSRLIQVRVIRNLLLCLN